MAATSPERTDVEVSDYEVTDHEITQHKVTNRKLDENKLYFTNGRRIISRIVSGAGYQRVARDDWALAIAKYPSKFVAGCGQCV